MIARTITTIQRELILPAILFTAAVLLSTCVVKPSAMADEHGSFNDQGNYSYHSYSPSSSLKPSPGHDGWDQYQYQRAQQDQHDRYRQESLRQQSERDSSYQTAPFSTPSPRPNHGFSTPI